MGVIAIIVAVGIGVYGGAAIQDKHEIVDTDKKQEQTQVKTTYNYNK